MEMISVTVLGLGLFDYTHLALLCKSSKNTGKLNQGVISVLTADLKKGLCYLKCIYFKCMGTCIELYSKTVTYICIPHDAHILES